MRIAIASKLLAGLPVAALLGVLATAQPPPPVRPVVPDQPAPQRPAAEDDAEVFARGPLHEAFAASGEQPEPSPVIEKRPPDPVEELPPDQRPEGDNVLWIPGYWHWDDEDTEFTWVSGFWRNAPAGRVWVPGDWREVKGGFQWVPGFWNVAAAKPEQPTEWEYLPPPPEPIEAGPSVVAPGDDCFYTPGCWVYTVNRYLWRPGFWVVHRPEWVWVPDCYRWTPSGYLFVTGYWDAPLATRGVLFAPVRFRTAVLDRPRFVYTPAYVVPDTSLHTCLFVRTGRAAYYFGDYFEQRYVGLGYSSWCGTAIRGSNFAVGVAVTRASYDPLWSYYSLSYRDTPQWRTNVAAVYGGRFKGDVPRPPRTLVQQNKVVNVSGVQNPTTTVIVNNPPAQAVLTPLAEYRRTTQAVAFRKVGEDDRVQEQKQARESRQFAAERRKVETALVDKGLAVTKGEKPRQARVEVPKAVAARVQPPTSPEKAPPPPATAAKKPDPKTDPVPATKPAVKPLPPVIDPKTGAVQPKKADDPKPTDPVKPGPKPTDPPAPKPGDPVKPRDPPKPPVKPTDPPKPGDLKPVDPKPKDPPEPLVTPPKPPVDPKPKDPPKPTDPKPVDPPKPPAAPPKPVDPPKPADPPKPPATPPKSTDPPAPKPADPPKPPDLKPKDPPKPVDPPKPPVTPPPPPKPVDPPKSPVTPPKPVDPPKPPAPKPVDPPKPPATPPKVDPPKPPVAPPAPPPKVDPPKPPVSPPVSPKPVDPPKPPVTLPPAPKPVDPPKPPATPPKPIDPPKPPVTPPKPVDPPKVDPPEPPAPPPPAPQPKDPPKQEKPKKDDRAKDNKGDGKK